MLQSIFKLFWSSLLRPTMSMLGWKKINSDVAKCYYHAQHLVKLKNREVKRFLLHHFISERFPNYEPKFNDNTVHPANVVTKIAMYFEDYLMAILKNKEPDEYLRVYVAFLLLSDDFLQFVDAYRGQDAITVEMGYQKFAPVWKHLGQNKYLGRNFE